MNVMISSNFNSMELPITSDVLTELELVHETGHFSSAVSLEEQWQQVSWCQKYVRIKPNIYAKEVKLINNIFVFYYNNLILQRIYTRWNHFYRWEQTHHFKIAKML